MSNSIFFYKFPCIHLAIRVVVAQPIQHDDSDIVARRGPSGVYIVINVGTWLSMCPLSDLIRPLATNKHKGI